MASQMKNTAPASIHKLVEIFEKNLDSYGSSKNETELRREFLDPFFTALGWDVSNEKGYDEAHKEVIHEFSVEVAGQGKKADYAFRTGADKFDFLVEAKKPSVKVETSQEAAFQIRRYGWSAKLPINILTDFEHLAVYDCRVKPSYNDKASFGRITLIHYKEYVERWDEIVKIFSPEAVRQGSFAKYAEGMKGKKGTADVDDAFLQEIERWRELLAKSIASNNEWIDISGLNYAVQMIIDRIVFLRICEERSIEPENQLQDITNKENIYKELCSLFKRADTKYNSGLFHFSKESGEASRADDLTFRLNIDDKTLKDIILNLYYPKSPYAFLYIPSDILGQVYERFLGKVIRLTDGHRAKVEEKPEVRKAGGVFYTPTFIVTYIVINTLGKLLFGLTPKETVKLKIVDPACGSGTFLLGAFEYLLAWHLKWYSENDPEKWVKNKVIVKFGNDYRLTTSKKKEILLNNIYGVDIDAQAVEVTKLSLLLKVLENASGQLELGMERILPDLGNNIKCGNSLVGEDYFSEFPEMISQEERTRINVFDWESAFPEVFAQGGFDVVVGNPPYGADLSGLLDYLLLKYPEAKKFPDSYCLFILKATNLLKQGGELGFVVPNTFCDLEGCNDFRLWLLSKNKLSKLYQSGWAFKDAIVDTVVFILEKNDSKENDTVSITIDETQYKRTIGDFLNSPLHKIDYRNNEDDLLLLNKIKSVPTLSDFVVAKAGVKLYEKGKGTPPQTEKTLLERPFTIKNKQLKGWLPLFRGEDINRYFIHPEKEFVNYGSWLAAPRSKDLFESPKILMRRTDDKIKSCLEFSGAICVNSCHVIKLNDVGLQKISYSYLLGLLNSKLLQQVFEIQNPQMIGKVFSEIKVIYVERLPIHPINFNDPAEKSAHDKIVALVESMLALHKSFASAQNPHEKERLEKQIKSADEGIDKLVYELYGLSQEEIEIVESK